MVKISIEEKEQIKITNDFKDKVMDSYNTTLFVTDKCKEIYDSEQTTLYKFVANKLNINITIEKPEEIKHVEQSKDFINITKSLKVKDYEAIFPKTIEYIKSSIFPIAGFAPSASISLFLSRELLITVTLCPCLIN
jgi:hypothetical protein